MAKAVSKMSLAAFILHKLKLLLRQHDVKIILDSFHKGEIS